MEPQLAAPANDPGAATSHAAIESPGRRRFLRFLLGFSVVSTISIIAAPIVGFLIPPKTAGGAAGGKVLAGTTADLPVGSGKVVAVGSKPVIVTNTEAGVTAFSAVCTHLGCIVGYDTTVRQIVCPCHDGHFNPSNGAVVSGPPPRPLAAVAVSIEKDQIFLLPGGG
jgi:cytochrome b6-f complex iron-sulfur subunit